MRPPLACDKPGGGAGGCGVASRAMAGPTLTIRSFRIRPVDAPLDPPLCNSLGQITRAPLVIAELQTEEGPRGTAYVFAYSPAALLPLAVLAHNIGETLAGRPCAPQTLFDELHDRFRLLGTEGLVEMALSVLDMAMWDALGVAAGVPLAKLLGGTTDPLPAYASLRGWGPAMLAEEAGAVVAAWGARAVKFKLGHPRLEDDLETVRAVRNAIGPDVEIMVDYNQGLNRPEALRRGLALQRQDVRWLEEPLHVSDDEGLAELSTRLTMPVQGGENWWGPSAMARSLAARATRLCMPDAMKMGGITGFLRGAALAAAARVPMSSHIFIEASAQCLPVVPTRHFLEHLDLAAPVLGETIQLRDGCALVPERPGLGLVWDEAAIARFSPR
jgi:mandelate racemase